MATASRISKTISTVSRPDHEPTASRDSSRCLLVGLCVLAAATRCARRRSEAARRHVYLFTSFRDNGEDGLQFLWSEDGYKWTEVPGKFLKPRVGPSQLMRDPSLLRGPDGTYHLVWTTGWKGDQGFGYAHSKDLVHWSPQQFVPVMEHEPTTVNVWAPELFYDEPNEQFIICWASTIPGRFPDHAEPHDNNQRMYYTTTRDFKTFAPAKLFFDPDFSVIDCVDRQGRRPLRARAQRKHAADAGAARGVWRFAARSVARRFGAVHRELHRRPDGAQARRRLAHLLRRLPRGHLRRGEDARLQDIHRHHQGSLVPQGPQARHRAPRAAEGPRIPAKGRPAASAATRGCRWSPNSPPTKSPKRLAAIDEVANRGPFQPNWESLGHFQTPPWYSRRQVRHLHPLGRVLGARLRQRMVSAQHVPRRARPSSSTTSPPTARTPSSATKISFRSSRPRSSTPPSGPSCSRKPARST